MAPMRELEMPEWLQHYLPSIPPMWGEGSTCGIERMKTRRAEHNPPFYWLGRALDLVEADGASQVMRARLLAAHGDEVCHRGERDDAAQRVLSEACAFAWTHTHLGVPTIEAAAPGADIERDRIRLAVPDHETYVLPARLRVANAMRPIFDDIADEAQLAADLLPRVSGRLLYLDMWYGREYPNSVGYDLDLTEPVQAALRHYCSEQHIGHVFTRPFQWGNPVETHY